MYTFSENRFLESALALLLASALGDPSLQTTPLRVVVTLVSDSNPPFCAARMMDIDLASDPRALVPMRDLFARYLVKGGNPAFENVTIGCVVVDQAGEIGVSGISNFDPLVVLSKIS